MKSLVMLFAFAAIIRCWLLYSGYKDVVSERIEVSTPINSIQRVTESCYREELGVDPYSSDMFHESPLHLRMYRFLIDNTGIYLPLVFVAVDLFTALLLYFTAKYYVLNSYKEQEMHPLKYPEGRYLLLNGYDYVSTPKYVLIAYLFNPYIIINCVGCTTTTFLNMSYSLILFGIATGQMVLPAAALILCAAQALYPVVLISPLFLSVVKRSKSKTGPILILALIFGFGALFAYACFLVHGGWDFLEKSYGFILGVSDQQPNIGVYWYFFMEMFEHFRQLFIYSYQMNVSILYFIPLTIKFRKEPLLLAFTFITLTAIFKSYPSIGDYAFTLAVLPCWKHMYNCMQQIFISGVAIFITTALGPILWDLWIFMGTANANFYFGSTLAFVTAFIFILTDVSFAYTKREYLLKYGSIREINGKEARLVLE